MRPFPKLLAAGALAALALATPARALSAQSLLDRPDNLSTDWVGNTGTLYFNFVHRFSESPAPEHKVSNFPTFLTAMGIAGRGLVGVNYATNSSLAARYPNEWEFFGRYAPWQQDEGAAFDLGGQVDYNLAVKGVDGELSIARREGPVRLVAVGRLIADTLGGDRRQFGYGGGGTIRLGRFLALAGDVASLTDRAPGEKVAWSAGLHVALPNTPHTLSLHVSNATTSTLQGLARGGDTKRYGFEFTVPVHLSRYFSSPEVAPPPIASESPAPMAVAATPDSVAAPRPAPAEAPASAPTAAPPTPSAAAPVRSPAAAARPTPSETAAPKPAPRRSTPQLFNARIKGQAYVPSTIEITAGTTVQWKNLDALIHTVNAVDKSFSSGAIGPDATFSHTFSKPGTYSIYCLPHPFMKATVVVK